MVKLHKKPKKEAKTLYQKMLKRNNTNKRMSTFEARRLKAKDDPLLFNSKTKKTKTLMDYYKDLMK